MEANAGTQVVRDFLPLVLIEEIKKVPSKTEKHRTNITSWDPKLAEYSSPILLFDLDTDLKNKVKEFVHGAVPNLKGEDLYGAVFTAGSKFSYLPWHTDGAYKAAITVYLNGYWERDFGGALLYEDPNTGQVHAQYPEFNKAVIVYPPIYHCTVMSNIHAPIRESLQLFFGYEEPNSTGARY